MPDKLIANTETHDLSTFHLTPDTFEPIYNTVVGLRFPMDVAQVLELRYLINQAVDAYPEPTPTPDYREFSDALQTAIDDAGIENKRHSERLLRILSMMRQLHYSYSINARNAETSLREQMAGNRRQRGHSVRYGLVFTVTAILSAIVWLGLHDPGWAIKAATAGFAIGAWLCLHTLPGLERALDGLEKRLNDLQRHRVKSIQWRTLIQKLALVLGYKRNSEVEVFRIDPELEHFPHPRFHH
jgi:hypothetical protein